MKTTMMIFMAVILSMSVSGQTFKDATAKELQPIFLKADSLRNLNIQTDVELGVIRRNASIGWKDIPNADTTEYVSVKVVRSSLGYVFTYFYNKNRVDGKSSMIRVTKISDGSESEMVGLIKPNPTFMSNIKSLTAKNNF